MNSLSLVYDEDAEVSDVMFTALLLMCSGKRTIFAKLETNEFLHIRE